MAVTVPGRFRPTEIEGHLACPPVSTKNGWSPRWAQIEVYALDAGGWLVHRAGMSYVYHRADTPCMTRNRRQSGAPVTSLDDLPDEAIPCEVCRPPYPQDLEDREGVVRFEFPRHTYDRCATPAQVIEKLTTIRGRDGSVSTVISDPVDELLEALEEHDRQFAELPRPAERWS